MKEWPSVVAVVSAFEPDESLVETVESVLGQVIRVIIVDDGSPSLAVDPDGSVRDVLDSCAQMGATVIELPANSGIAAALNRGIEAALADGADAVLTLDQDTRIGPDYVRRMIDHLDLAASLGMSTVMLSPSEINGDVAPFWFAHRGLTLAFEPLQSGMLFPRGLFAAVGLFDESLFIDCVETEFYLRARAHGAHALVVPGAAIDHSLGRTAVWRPPQPLRGLMRGRGAGIEFSEDAPFRHYYIARNRLTLYRRYWRSEPLWTMVSLVKDSAIRGRAMMIGSRRMSRIYLTASGFRASWRGETGRIPARTLRRSRGRRAAEAPRERITRQRPRTPSSVSVVIPVRNAMDSIDGQLAALAEQTYPGWFEVLLCDNGSDDGLRQHIQQHRLRVDVNMRVVDASARVGASYARNVGISESEGDLIAFCDADDMVHPQWLERLVACAAHHDVVSGGIETTTLNDPEVMAWRPMPPSAVPFELPGFLRVVTGANMAAWSDVLAAAGGFDEAYTRGYEDADLALRVQLQGGTVGHAADALVAYRLRDSLRGLWSQSVTYGQGLVQLFSDYRGYGMRGRPLYYLLDLLAFLILRNPLLPQRLTRVSGGHWLFHAGNLVGRIRGSIRHRRYFV
ncbi:MAG: glycosyl transferase [Gordonia sp.]|uniref:glycosyltransferase family 2 protein n=1 Tax=Gordonia sp. (in: high G+C Gram-positive bacteria) TaxID=84139 RepID=UPI000C370E3A|nr:glycosyltransferase [Gordonia sp. (in: high G+C Gram-positive bacteria)]MAU82346.1 glycosyl transferase [Gordonia sp. (in: high G+C Gram-positive bacteria)]